LQKPDLTTLIAFLFVVIIGGSNAVAVRFSNLELPPFWGAALRFSAAALVFWIIVFAFRIKIPKGREFVGAMIFGIFSIGMSYAFIYWGLVQLQAGLAMVVLAFTPLMTFFLAILHGLEKFRWRGFAGALIAISGILNIVRGSLGTDIPVLSLLAIAAGALSISEGNVYYKFIPNNHPLVVNAIAVSTGALLLLLLSLFTGEVWTLPDTASALVAVSYLVLIGSVLLFYLYLFVLSRWTASATAYSFLLFPISTFIIAAWLMDESITPAFVLGGILVLIGVWLGAISGQKRTGTVREGST
jgi:drug/metabolite transporter (DMT)-like permease